MIRIALVGCGGMAHWHADRLKQVADCKVVALVDTDTPRMSEFRKKHFPDAVEHASYDGMLESARDKIDAVLLITPHTLHYSQSKSALERGLHVMVEKPMVTSSEHAYDLWKTVQRTGKTLAITIQAPYSNEYGYLAQERDAGRLGKVQIVSAILSQGWLAATKGMWRQDPALSGGGQMYDSGAHVLNGIMWLMNSPVIEVGCFYDTCGSKVDINGAIIARFQNGALASIAIGGNCPAWKTEINIQTDKMLIVTDSYGGKLEMTGRDGRKIYPHVHPDERPAAGSPHLNFVNAVLGREPLRAPVRYGVLLSALMDAIYQSADTQTLVKVKPVPEEL